MPIPSRYEGTFQKFTNLLCRGITPGFATCLIVSAMNRARVNVAVAFSEDDEARIKQGHLRIGVQVYTRAIHRLDDEAIAHVAFCVTDQLTKGRNGRAAEALTADELAEFMAGTQGERS